MVDRDHRVVVFNQRMIEMLNLPPALLESRPRFEALLDYQWAQDEFATATKGVVGFVRAGGLISEPHVYERTRPNGRVIEVRSRPLPGGGLVRTYTDITERKAADARIRFIAHHDGLTMLANRVVLQDHLDQAVATCAASGQGLALLYIDLDRFKPINDTHGHAVGDQLLIEVASRMRGMVREEDLVARMGGDEFAIVQTAVTQPEAAASLAQRLIERMAEPFLFNGMRLAVGLSIGIAVYPSSGVDAAELRRNADVALYRAKEAGRNIFQFFDADMDRRQQARFQMEQDLRDAVGQHAFHLVYQPIWDVGTDAVVGFETLLRWNHPTRGPVGPEEFVPLAEANGLIVPLGRWVLQTRLRRGGDLAGAPSARRQPVAAAVPPGQPDRRDRRHPAPNRPGRRPARARGYGGGAAGGERPGAADDVFAAGTRRVDHARRLWHRPCKPELSSALSRSTSSKSTSRSSAASTLIRTVARDRRGRAAA